MFIVLTLRFYNLVISEAIDAPFVSYIFMMPIVTDDMKLDSIS